MKPKRLSLRLAASGISFSQQCQARSAPSAAQVSPTIRIWSCFIRNAAVPLCASTYFSRHVSAQASPCSQIIIKHRRIVLTLVSSTLPPPRARYRSPSVARNALPPSLKRRSFSSAPTRIAATSASATIFRAKHTISKRRLKWQWRADTWLTCMCKPCDHATNDSSFHTHCSWHLISLYLPTRDFDSVCMRRHFEQLQFLPLCVQDRRRV